MRRVLMLFTLGLAFGGVVWAADGDWPSYNRTLTSERFSPDSQVTTQNISQLKVINEYDTGIRTGFQCGPLVVDGTLYFTTEKATFALNGETGEEKWRVSEDVGDSYLKVNRGVAYMDGRLFRGLQDGRVVAYDASNGRRVWQTRIASDSLGESVPAAPIAWNGMVFIGNAGGDNKGVKGRMYALDAATGRVLWETYLVPRTRPVGTDGAGDSTTATRSTGSDGTDGRASGAGGSTRIDEIAAPTWRTAPDLPITGGATWTSYTLDPSAGLLYVPGGNPAPDFAPALRPGQNLFTNSIVVLDAKTGAYRTHYSIVPQDFHDWDMAGAPALFTSRAGKRLLAATPKDGFLYVHDLATGKRLYRVPVTSVVNADTPLGRRPVRFCPGTQGGSEWNGPAYDPQTDLIYTGAVDWCSTVALTDPAKLQSVAAGQPWTGSADSTAMFGKLDPAPDRWAGWLYATQAATGQRAWRFRAPTPVLSAVTPTAGGLVFFGDMNGKVYALDARGGKVLWSQDTGGAVAGGVISYVANGKQRIAVCSGMTSAIWPTPEATAKVVVYGLE